MNERIKLCVWNEKSQVKFEVHGIKKKTKKIIKINEL